MAVGVRAVKLVDGFSSIAWVVVCDKGGSDGAVVAIEEHSAGCDGTNAGEELVDIVLGQFEVDVLNSDASAVVIYSATGRCASVVFVVVVATTTAAASVVVIVAVMDPVAFDVCVVLASVLQSQVIVSVGSRAQVRRRSRYRKARWAWRLWPELVGMSLAGVERGSYEGGI